MKFKLSKINFKEKFFNFFENFEIRIKEFIDMKLQFIYKFDYREVLKFFAYLLVFTIIAFFTSKIIIYIHFEIITLITFILLFIFIMFLIYARDWIVEEYSIETYASFLRITVFANHFLLLILLIMYSLKF